MELEHIFLAVAILTLASNIILVLFLVRNIRLRNSTKSKQFLPQINQPNNKRSTGSIGNQEVEELPTTEIM